MQAVKEPKQAAPEMPTRETFDALVREASAGAPEALAKLNKLLDEQPHIWRNVGDLGRHAERTLVLNVAKDDALARESIARRVEEMRQELCGPKPTPMEKILIDRFVLAWLELQHVSMAYPSTADMSPAAGRFVLQQKESAARRLNSAQQALDTHRKLLPPKLTLRKAVVPFRQDKPEGRKVPPKR